MKYHLTKHAGTRLKERNIPISLLESALQNPNKVMYDNKGHLLLIKLYKKVGRPRLLLVAVAMGDIPNVLMVIDTSKVKKYL